jgi:hypothetical protein
VKFSLRAHHMQAQTLQRRFADAEHTWSALDAVLTDHALPDRVADPLFDAVLGYRVRRPSYVKRAEIEVRTASRDLNRLVAEGLLEAHGQTRARYYLAGAELRELGAEMRNAREPLRDPYPWLAAELRNRTGR